MDNGEYAPFHDRLSAPALWSQLTPAIPDQRPRQPYPERISYTCRSGELFIVAIRPAIRDPRWRESAGSGTLGAPTESGEIARDRRFARTRHYRAALGPGLELLAGW